ncbi:hypothetical protein PVAND_001485 [Polypedilum vanderplanki]|uniref:HAT C-terminal dimerisation domain-containing protein n=1 Tax=Polypedilum vanderplanki TaxID=319348 RepID=A0A9J6BNJ8_POLVA|nr:hypothetical protein PVAND_001485 [Polypedilum vanderplanki]
MLNINENQFDQIHKFLIYELKKISHSEDENYAVRTTENHNTSSKSKLFTSSSRISNFFGFDNSQLDEDSSMRDEILLFTYYDEKEYSFQLFDSLKYERVKKLFFKLNVVTCSSASTERVFSAAKHVLISDRTNTTSDNFERLLMLKLNKHEMFKKI